MNIKKTLLLALFFLPGLSFAAKGIWKFDFNIPFSYGLEAVIEGEPETLTADGSPFGGMVILEPKINFGIGFESISQGLRYGIFDNVTSRLNHSAYSLTYKVSWPSIRMLFGLGSGQMSMRIKDQTSKFEGEASITKLMFQMGYRFDTALEVHFGYHIIPGFEIEVKNSGGNKKTIQVSANYLSLGVNFGF